MYLDPGSLSVPKLSIVIPVVGDPRQLEDTLVSVLENRPANCEIFVVHNEPYEDPYDLGDEVLFVAAERGASLADCLNQGLSASRASIVHVLACGATVRPCWTDAALRHFSDPEVAAVVVSGSAGLAIVSAGLEIRAEGTALRLGQGQDPADATMGQRHLWGPDFLAGFYRRSALKAVHGFSSWADPVTTAIDAALALRHAGLRCELEPECLVHLDAPAVCDPSSFAQGRDAERLFWRWASAQGWARSLSAHTAMLWGQCVICLRRLTMLAQLAGRTWGAFQAMVGQRGPKPVALAPAETPSVVAMPDLASARLREKHNPARAA